jgi:hypothetical protein
MPGIGVSLRRLAGGMLKKSASIVLRLESILKVAQEATPPVLSLAAALLDGLFEHPAGVFSSRPNRAGHRNSSGPKWFFSILLEEFRFDQVADLACSVA